MMTKLKNDELLNIHRIILAIRIIFFFYLSELTTDIHPLAGWNGCPPPCQLGHARILL